VDHCHAVVVLDDADLERLTSPGRTDEHRDLSIVGFEGSPVVSKGVEHVVIGDAVLAGPQARRPQREATTRPPDRQHVLTMAWRADRQFRATYGSRSKTIRPAIRPPTASDRNQPRPVARLAIVAPTSARTTPLDHSTTPSTATTLKVATPSHEHDGTTEDRSQIRLSLGMSIHAATGGDVK
jgi:hypothetical protein